MLAEQGQLTAAERRRIRLQQEDQEELEQARWRYDPVAFAEECFGITPWGKQAAILEAVSRHHRVATRSGHKVSKTNTAALLAYWFPVVYPGGRVVCTSSSHRQVEKQLWREVRALSLRAKRIGKLSLPHVAKSPNTGIEWPDGRDVCGFSTDNTENFGGFSGSAVLFIVDEASGVPEDIFEAIEGNLAGGSSDDDTAVAKIVLFGNPTQTSGTFYDAFNSQKNVWRTYHVSSRDTPNCIEGRVVIPGLATRDWVEQKRKQWGEDDPRYQVRVDGNFPTQNAYAVIKLGTVEAAVERFRDRERAESQAGRLEIGLDVARFGDDNSVAIARRGKAVLRDERGSAIASCHGFDEYEVAGMALALARRFHVKGEQRPLIKVDVIGVGGGVATILRHATDPQSGEPLCDVLEINVAEKAYDEKEYHNKRTEVWFLCNEWLKTGAIPEHDQLHKELIAPKYSFDDKGRVWVERKRDMKKTLGFSPDFADALCLAVYSPVNASEPAATSPENAPVTQGGLRWGHSGCGRGFG